MTRPAGRSNRLSPPAIGFPALTVVTSSARSHLAATSCHTTAGAGRRGEGGSSSLCREWSAPNSLRDRPEPSDRNKRLPRYRDWQRPLSGCRLRGVADRSGASSASDLVGRFRIVLLGPNHAVVDRLLLLLEQILEDELTPSAAACVHQRATLVELSQLD